ncbi:MAG: LON peptidase substrate-binding domain-containing protein [Acidobacteriota bacterium]|jgi:uncharacterized protein
MDPYPVPDVIPIFPLRQTVLLPGEVLPLHIFEHRYRKLVADVLETHNVIGMVQWAPGAIEGSVLPPPVREVGCAGLLYQHLKMDDGRYLVWLLGLQKFHIAEELESITPYRQVRVDYPPGPLGGRAPEHLTDARLDLLASFPFLLRAQRGGAQSLMEQLASVDDDQFIAVSAQILGLSSEQKQALLEAGGIGDRYGLLREELSRRLKDGTGPFDSDRWSLN